MSLHAAETKIASGVEPASASMRDRGAISRTTLATRLAIAMTLVVVITVIAVGWLNYRSLEQALLPRVLDRIEAHARLMATELESHAAGARRDVASYRFIPGFAGLIRARMAGGADPTDNVPVNVWRQRIAMHFTAELEAKPAYAMIRLIGVDDNQREIVRVVVGLDIERLAESLLEMLSIDLGPQCHGLIPLLSIRRKITSFFEGD